MHALTRFAASTLAASIGCSIVHSANADAPEDACAFLTPARISAAIGTPVGAGTYVTPTFKRTCTWTATTGATTYVTLFLQTASSYDGGRQLVLQATAKNVTALSGVGDDAYYFGIGTAVGLLVKKGTNAFKVAIYGQQSLEQKMAMEKVLAQEVVSEL